MPRWITPFTSLTIAVVIAMPAIADPGTAPSAGPAPDAVPEVGRPATARITLVTGDQVIVTTRRGRPDQVAFRPGRGSGSSSAVISHSRGHTFAVPAAALRDVATGRLDRTLFDVTTLLRERRDDRRSATVPVIVEYAAEPATALARVLPELPHGVTAARLLRSLGGRAFSLPKTATSTFWRSTRAVAAPRRARPAGPAIKRIWLDRRVTVALDHSVQQIGVPAARRRGLTGKGVKIAVLDTGIDPKHPDLRGQVTRSANFSTSKDTVDRAGHGTHVASTIAGTGAASGGKYRGVAPGAELLNGKVLDDEGSGNESDIIAGMEWAVRAGARIVNVSLGSDDSDGQDPVSKALNDLSRRSGTLFVVAAGNCSDRHRIGSPGAADMALTVANLDRDGSPNESSCRGPRTGDQALKPEIAAPGTGIVAARAAGSELGEPVGPRYQALTGTSMATPHVAGTAALLAQANPRWTAAQLKTRLITTADPPSTTAPPPPTTAGRTSGGRGPAPAAGVDGHGIGGATGVDSQGAGRVDAAQATGRSVTVNTGRLDYGMIRWPHPAATAVRRTLRYSNPGTRPVTLDLTVRMDGDGRAPELDKRRVVVPARGRAEVEVIGRPGEGAVGRHTGRILAKQAGKDPLVSTFGWYLEPEMYDLTIRGVLPGGGPADALVTVDRPDGGEIPDYDGMAGPDMVAGVATTRMRPGVYTVSTILSQDATDEQPETYALMVEPELTISANTTVTFDARDAMPADASVVGGNHLRPRSSGLFYLRIGEDGSFSGFEELEAVGSPVRLLASPTPRTTIGKMEFSTGARLELPPYRARVTGLLGRRLPVTDYLYGPRFSGVRELTAYDAGTARPDELRGVRGKLAVVRRTARTEVGQQARAAQRAGAAAVLTFDPDQPGLPAGEAFGPDGATIPVLRTDRTTGRTLLDKIRKRAVRVEITGTAASPVVYDLVVPWADRIPAWPSYRALPHEFARVDESFGAHAERVPTTEARVGITPLGAWLGLWNQPAFAAPLRRTSFVLAGPVSWDQRVIVNDHQQTDGFVSWVNSARHYRAGERTTVRWVEPVANSGLPVERSGWESAAGVVRRGGRLFVGLAPFMHGPDQYEDPLYLETGSYRLTASRNLRSLGTGELPLAEIPVPPGPAAYRIGLDARRKLSGWRYSTRVRSIWDFRSTGGATETLPLVLADLWVPAAAGHTVQTGASTAVILSLRHQTGSVSSPFTRASLQASYDGRTWTALTLRPTGGNSFTAKVTHPPSRAGKPVHLRIDVQDAAGGRLQQEVTDAYSLK